MFQSRVYRRASLEDRGAVDSLSWLSSLRFRTKLPLSVSSDVFLYPGPFLELIGNLKDSYGDRLHVALAGRALACASISSTWLIASSIDASWWISGIFLTECVHDFCSNLLIIVGIGNEI